jgi:ParB family transcriptional regulator, chromosome partitioning protein
MGDNLKTGEIVDVKLDNLIPFRKHSSQIYQGERLEQLMSSIERLGLMNPIIVRPVSDGKYEIICGHNRAKAVSSLGYESIKAEVKNGLTDDEALEYYYDSNLNQQSFSDWSYSQRIEAIKYSEKLIKEHSQQGKRTDLEKKNQKELDAGTSVYSGQKLDENSKPNTTRDKMARRLGIATATLSKYRSILKIQDDMIDQLTLMLDKKRITFEVAYRISKLKPDETKSLLRVLERNLLIKPNVESLKVIIGKSKASENSLTEKEIRTMLISQVSE